MAGLVGASAGASELSMAAMMAQMTQSAKQTTPAPQTVEAPKSYYVSPHTIIDTSNSKAVLVLRDSATGAIQVQVPATISIEKAIASEQRLREVLSAGITTIDLPEPSAAEFSQAVQSNKAVVSNASVIDAQNFSAQASVPDMRAAISSFAAQAAPSQSVGVLIDA